MERNDRIIKIAVRKFGPFESALQKIWSNFQKQTGTDYILEAIPMDLYDLHKAILKDRGLKEGRFDIAHISADWMGEAIEIQAIEDINALCSLPVYSADPLNTTCWSPSLLRSQLHEDQLFGLPFHDGPECLVYRKDLMEDSLIKEDFLKSTGNSLQIPENWNAFLQIAEYFGQSIQIPYGVGMAGFADGHNAVYDFCTHIWTRGGEFMDNTGKVDLLNEKVFDAMTYIRSLFQGKQIMHPDSGEFDSVRLGQAFAKGEIFMMINWFGFATYGDQSSESVVKGKVGVAKIPFNKDQNGCSVSPNSYWIYSIGSGSKHKDLALQFIRFATNQENDRLLTLEGGIGCRISSWHDKKINELIPYFHELEILHQYARELPNIPDWPQIAMVIDSIMQEVILSEKDIQILLEQKQHFINNRFQT